MLPKTHMQVRKNRTAALPVEQRGRARGLSRHRWPVGLALPWVFEMSRRMKSRWGRSDRRYERFLYPCATCPPQSIGTRYVAATTKFVAIFHAAAGDRGHRSTRAAAPVRLPV